MKAFTLRLRSWFSRPWRSVLLLGLGTLMIGSMVAIQPAQAAPSPSATPGDAAAVEQRQEAYDEALEVIDNPRRGTQEKYEENLSEYRQEHPDQGGLVEEAKELVKKVAPPQK
jgi:hypothetical protein